METRGLENSPVEGFYFKVVIPDFVSWLSEGESEEHRQNWSVDFSIFGLIAPTTNLKIFLSHLATNNGFISLPEDLSNCSKMLKLDLEGNKLTVLSEKLLGSWTSITELNAAKNTLNGIPENIGGLTRLIHLDLHQNRISVIPSSIMGCSFLAEFYIGNNFLTSIPTETGQLTNLGTFDLHSNKLKEYPVEACKLKLSVLDLSNNSLSSLPPEIGLMTTLRRLVLTGNPIWILRSSLVMRPTPALLRSLRSRLPAEEA